MKKSFLNIFFLTLAIFGFLFISSNANAQEISEPKEPNKVQLYFFHSKTCAHCKAENKFLNKIKNNFTNLEIIPIDVYGKENPGLFERVVDKFELSGGVPVTIIGGEAIVGFDNEMGIGRKIKKKIRECSFEFCDPFLTGGVGAEPILVNDVKKEVPDEGHDSHKTVQILGREICLEENGSLCFLGAVLGLADGVNPCMFSVLMFLLVYLMGIGSSKKALKAGIAFIITTFLFYLFFMYGLIQIISVLKIANEVRVFISIFALIVGLVMIKDYFFYGKWFSFEISKKAKPLLEKLTKKGTVFSSIVLALLASIVELPCTSGIPLAYVSILSSSENSTLGYLILYNLFFVLPLLVIVIGTIFVWKKVEKLEAWREKVKKYMRLVAGVLLVLLAIMIWNNWI